MQLKETLAKMNLNKCKIEVYGLGYVGFPLAVKLAISGLNIIGVDINSERINRLKNNILMESEFHLKNEFEQARQKDRLILTDKPISTTEPKIGIICVPTPIPKENIQSNVYVKSAIEGFLKTSKNGDIIIIESSIEVGTTDEMLSLIEKKGYSVGKNFGLCFCPERIDPLNTKWKLDNTPRVIYCSDNITFNVVQKIYQHVNDANLIRVNSAKVAEVVKSFENAFRLVNISLVNELAMLCDKLKINVSDVITAASTKPFGFMPFHSSAGAGGHCIPKDPRFLLRSAERFGVDFDTIDTALKINSIMPKYIVNSISQFIEKDNLEKTVLICGLSYKPDIEDMRDSPGFKIIKEFNERNYKVFAYDPFYKKEMKEKYLAENHLEKLDFIVMNDLNEDIISKVSCLCIVQHHTKIKFRVNEIYEQNKVPIIYDCQNKMNINTKSKTILKHLGG